MPAQLRFKGGAVGQYFEGQVGDAGRVLIREVHVSTCAHCQALSQYPSQKRMMEFVEICRGCMKLICLECLGKPCHPAEQEADRVEAEWRLQQRVGRMAWGCY